MVEAEAVVVIFGKKVTNIVWKHIVCRFGLPHTFIGDNGKNFVEYPFKNWCQEKGIKQKFT